ncbi:MAG: hypothetical protein VX834_12630 [Myxococcota bacterium]|nr:hypothetical protein [Myxococcota bacterium]
MIRAYLSVFGVSLCLLACAAPNAGESLRASVGTYNQSMRWKRYNTASTFLAPDKRADFLEQYLNVEDDLHVQSVEVRSVNSYERDGKPIADVVVVAEAYLLPSTVVRKTTMIQTWLFSNGGWELIDPGTSLAKERSTEAGSSPL